MEEKMEKLIPFVDSKILESEITGLPSTAKLIARGKFEVYLAKANQIPNILREIGRLRELTFRLVGEGTGKALDIDQFDEFYYNLFIWNAEENKIVGGYRVGPGAEILNNYGIDGFYISSLFDIKNEAHQLLNESIELGRSYIISEYQMSYLPLFLLWQGILIFLNRHPTYRYLIGPVSISKFYSNLSKSMIVAFVKKHFFDDELSKLFTPHTPFLPELEEVDMNDIDGADFKDLESFISKIEPTHIKVPILLKQYTKLNARFLSFNIDPNFSNALDGLMLLDLKKMPPETLAFLQKK